MPPVATDVVKYRWRRGQCVLGTRPSHVKMTEPINMPFGRQICVAPNGKLRLNDPRAAAMRPYAKIPDCVLLRLGCIACTRSMRPLSTDEVACSPGVAHIGYMSHEKNG